MTMVSILVVEDEPMTLQGLERFLTGRGFSVLTAANGADGLELALERRPDAIVLDITLPEMDGLTVCRELRERGVNSPVLFLTAKDQELDKLTGFGVGGDDYLTKPASLLELEARLRVALRRTATSGAAIDDEAVTVGDACVDLASHEVRTHDRTEILSAKEAELLRCFLENRGKVLSREYLLETVWGYSSDASSRTVDTHVLNLRRKLRDTDGQCTCIKTVRGVGYRFAP
jgi:two-component system alkaline phosphatase synthesis response regulator PhoP